MYSKGFFSNYIGIALQLLNNDYAFFLSYPLLISYISILAISEIKDLQEAFSVTTFP